MPVPTKLSHLMVVSLALTGACFLGCDRSDGISEYTAPKDPPPSVAPQSASGEKPIAWQLPNGWAEIADSTGAQFGRFATIQVDPADPALALTVNVLQGGGSGELLPNLNRWEGTLGLTPTPAAEAEKKAKPIEVDGHTGQRVDLTGVDNKSNTPARLLGFILPHGEEAWSFKLQGAPEKIAAQEAAFDAFIASVKFLVHNHGDAPTAAADDHADHDHAGHDHAEGEHPAPAGAPGAQAPAPATTGTPTKLTGFTVPASWKQDPTERMMRAATFFIGEGNGRAEAIVTKLRLNGFGSMLDNINRWRREVGLQPATNDQSEKRRALTINGVPAVVFDFAGPEAADSKRSNVAMLATGSDVWFVKLIGPSKTVTDQQANFDAFLQSLQFGEAGE